MVTKIWVNIGSGNEAMLTNHQWGLVLSPEGYFKENAQDVDPWLQLRVPWGQWVNWGNDICVEASFCSLPGNHNCTQLEYQDLW